MRPEQLQRHRERLQLTQKELADQLGTTQATIARWEGGQRPIPDMAARLLDCLARQRRTRVRRSR
jgi:DNA-binding transcriptional regulator YiaG